MNTWILVIVYAFAQPTSSSIIIPGLATLEYCQQIGARYKETMPFVNKAGLTIYECIPSTPLAK